jgi:hypothetical protein
MKKRAIFFVFVLMLGIIMVTIIIIDRNKIKEQKIELIQKQDSVKIYKKKYNQCTRQFREHISKCSFIARSSIKKQNGQYITLYLPYETIRK